jgi:hypothetical protein
VIRVRLREDPQHPKDTVSIGGAFVTDDQMTLEELVRTSLITCHPDDAHIYRRQIEEADDMEIVE